MRDPARIEEVLEAVCELWHVYPDWRLCQLVVNVAGSNDPFNVEDDTFLNSVRAWCDLHGKPKERE